MIIKTKEGQEFSEKLLKVKLKNNAKPINIIQIQSEPSSSQSPIQSNKNLSPLQDGGSKVKRVTIPLKEQSGKLSSSLDEIRVYQRNLLIKQFPIPYSEQIPKKVDVQSISTFLRPRTSSFNSDKDKKHSNFYFHQSPISKNIPQSPYVEKMIQKTAKKIVEDYSQIKEKQSFLDKLTPRQYILLTKQNVNEDSPQINKMFHKYAVWIPNQESNLVKCQPFTTIHYNSIETNSRQQKTSHFPLQNSEKNNIKYSLQHTYRPQNSSPKNSNSKLLPSFTFKQQEEQNNTNNHTNEINITQVSESNLKVDLREREPILIEEAEGIEEHIQSQQTIKSHLQNTQKNIQNPVQPRFLITSKKLQEFHYEQFLDQQEQYQLEKPDRLNINFVNNLILDAKYIERVQGMYYQKQEEQHNIIKNVKERAEQNIEKLREVARPPSKEQLEFTTYMKEYEKQKAQSIERKHERISKLKINQERKVIWKKFDVDNISRSKSPSKNQTFINKTQEQS